MRKIIFVFLFSFNTICSNAYSHTGEQWLEICNTKDINPNFPIMRHTCMSYLKGIIDMEKFQAKRINEIIEIIGSSPASMFAPAVDSIVETHKTCLPKNVTYSQIQKIMHKSLNEHPERLHFGLSRLFVKIMKETFPCKTQ
tara:strand:- start:105 stop:527 length:423 start_codon:yes stop_codon:yes gene_type:complete